MKTPRLKMDGKPLLTQKKAAAFMCFSPGFDLIREKHIVLCSTIKACLEVHSLYLSMWANNTHFQHPIKSTQSTPHLWPCYVTIFFPPPAIRTCGKDMEIYIPSPPKVKNVLWFLLRCLQNDVGAEFDTWEMSRLICQRGQSFFALTSNLSLSHVPPSQQFGNQLLFSIQVWCGKLKLSVYKHTPTSHVTWKVMKSTNIFIDFAGFFCFHSWFKTMILSF